MCGIIDVRRGSEAVAARGRGLTLWQPTTYICGMQTSHMRPSNSAEAIAAGLIRTGRAAHAECVGDVLRLERRAGGFYWIRFDGAELARGDTLLDAEPLQEGFASAMVSAGRSSK